MTATQAAIVSSTVKRLDQVAPTWIGFTLSVTFLLGGAVVRSKCIVCVEERIGKDGIGGGPSDGSIADGRRADLSPGGSSLLARNDTGSSGLSEPSRRLGCRDLWSIHDSLVGGVDLFDGEDTEGRYERDGAQDGQEDSGEAHGILSWCRKVC